MRQPAFGGRYRSRPSTSVAPPLAVLLKSRPFSCEFEHPVKTAYDAADYLRALHGSEDIPYAALVRNFRALIKQYGPDGVGRMIYFAAEVSHYPFSTKMVKTLCGTHLNALEKT